MEKTRLIRYALLSLIGVAIMYIIPFIVAQGSFQLSLLDPVTGIFLQMMDLGFRLKIQ